MATTYPTGELLDVLRALAGPDRWYCVERLVALTDLPADDIRAALRALCVEDLATPMNTETAAGRSRWAITTLGADALECYRPTLAVA